MSTYNHLMINQFKFESINTINSTLEKEIRTLETLCNKSDGTRYQLFLENTYNADRTIDFIYLYRHEGKIVSFLLLFFPTISDVEVYGFTHPDYRRRGLFSSLLEYTNKALKPLGSYSHLFVCDPSSTSGIGFISGINGLCEEIEYMMELNFQAFHTYLGQREKRTETIVMKEATMEDCDQISSIASTMYDGENSASSEFVKQTILSDKRQQLIGTVNGKIIGICTIGKEEESMMINGLAIERIHQGRGLGRDLLDQILEYIEKKYAIPIKLEVSSINDKAYKLYKSVGFEQMESYGYYRIKND